MQRRQRLWVSAIALGLVTLSALAHAALSKPTDASVTFQAVGPAGLKIEGTTTDLNVTEDGGNVVISVPLANLHTGIDVRDRHMKEKYLEVEKYPEAKLTLVRGALKLPASGEKVQSDMPGTLSIHGQTRPASVHYEIKADGAVFSVTGKIRVNMKEVGITVPVYLGITVKPDVDVDVHFRVAGA